MTKAQRRKLVERLFLERVGEVRRFVTATMPEPELSDEIIQEVFVAITTKADHYDPEQSFSHWLAPFVRQKMVEVGKRAESGAQPFADEVLEVLSATWSATVASPVRRQFLEECVGKLAPQARKIVELRYRKAMKPGEIATLIGWTRNSVNVAMSRSRAAIRECLDGKIVALQQG
jgi:RNA polymerase sigma factor (sigma-70 family)